MFEPNFISIRLFFLVFLYLSSCFGYAGENNVAAYVGGGKSKSNTDTPFTLGFLVLPNSQGYLWGADFSKEGTKLDSTWGQSNQTNSASSYNLLFGKNLMFLDNSRIDIAFLFGARESAESCPRSYLGYKCYADRQSDTKYEFNSGLGLFWSQNKMLFGIRATTVSTQLLIGAKF